ncbi:hypothetical protein MAM1_0052d03434 [Mucor ambiguus]|uniref:Rap-GAP domain-containing protein n=1 Tax=Mucor ambiguus TaxID=91626 RepID=A0A0C9MPM2_9FUNG|nr:hypothetical protein MAM1_0052d03434 [Mucor ambiguus]
MVTAGEFERELRRRFYDIMNLNNESAFTSIPAPTKRSSLSSRASKIPQKLAQSAFFSLKPSASTLINPNATTSPSNDRLSTRISHMLFRQRTTSESIIRESRSSSTQSLDYGSDHGTNTGRNYPSRSLDIPTHEAGRIYTKRNLNSNPLTATTAALDNNQTQSSPSSSPYSISSPERTDFYSYYYYYNNNNNNNNNGGGHYNTSSHHHHNSSNSAADTVKDEFNLFSPLSFSNSSVSSFADSILNHHITPPPSPMLHMIIKNDKSSTPALTKSSIEEFANALIEHCTHLIDMLNTTNTANAIATTADSTATTISDDMGFSHVRELELLSNQTMTLMDACDESLCLQDARQYIQQEDLYVPIKTMKSFLVEIQTICEKCLTLYKNAPCLSFNVSDGFKKETTKIDSMMYTAKHYKELQSDQIDANASWFRHYFVGKPYHTFIGSLKQEAPANLPLIETTTTNTSTKKSKSKLNSYFGSNSADETPLANDSVGIISVIQERAKDFSGPGNGAAAILGSQYRIIIRSKETEQVRYIIHECMAKETQSLLEARGDSNKLDKCTSNHHDKRLRPFIGRNLNQNGSSMPQLSDAYNTTTSRMLRAAILSVCPNIDLRSFKELSAESTIMAGLEKDLLKYDEIHVPKHYKFGVLTIRDNQTTEESWFSNTGLSERLQDFLDIMGQKIKLKGYKGYSAGLDTKTGESGEYAYISKWNEFDIMYHVAPLMPSQKNDKQQVLRKKHIGNDIVCIIFLEGSQTFNPKAIRSQFLHVYIIIRPEVVNDKKCWRVEVLTKSNVGEFGPPIPSPPLLYDDDTLKEFLTLKLINAENAALKSDKFFIPNNKARLGLLSTYIQAGLSFNIPQVLRSASTNRLSSNKSSSYLSVTKQQQQQQQKRPQRPKSVNNKSPASSIGSNGSSRLLREAILDEEKRNRSTMASTEIPPMPTISRSTLLQDLKKGFVSGSKKIKGEKSITRKTSQLKISTTPNTTKQELERVCELDGSGSRPTKKNEMFVGKDINISSEGFLSTEQLFSTADAASQPTDSTVPTAKKSTAPAHHRFAMKPFPAKSNMRPPNLILDTTTTATATTSMSNSHVSGLSW